MHRPVTERTLVSWLCSHINLILISNLKLSSCRSMSSDFGLSLIGLENLQVAAPITWPEVLWLIWSAFMLIDVIKCRVIFMPWTLKTIALHPSYISSAIGVIVLVQCGVLFAQLTRSQANEAKAKRFAAHVVFVYMCVCIYTKYIFLDWKVNKFA